MATTIEGQSIYVGQIVKKVTVPDGDIPATGANKIIGPVFEMNHKDKVTVAVRVVSGPDIRNVQLMRVFSDGVASEESISAGGFAADDGPTFAVTYNVPKLRIDYEIAASTGVDSVVLIEVEGGVGA